MTPKLFMVFDVESVGLHGEGYAVGIVTIDGTGVIGSPTRFACNPDAARGPDGGREWLRNNAPPLNATHQTPSQVREAFWRTWRYWKGEGALLVADCGWPVEARFLAACVEDDPSAREWEGPYPMHELATFMVAAGMDPMAKYPREPDELPIHDPLADARQSARLLRNALARPPTGHEVYARPECLFNYCPNVEECKAADRCLSPYKK